MELGKGLRRQLLNEIVKLSFQDLTPEARSSLERRIREFRMPGSWKGKPPLEFVVRAVVSQEKDSNLLQIVGHDFVRASLALCQSLQQLDIDPDTPLDEAVAIACDAFPQESAGDLRRILAFRGMSGPRTFRRLIDAARLSAPEDVGGSELGSAPSHAPVQALPLPSVLPLLSESARSGSDVETNGVVAGSASKASPRPPLEDVLASLSVLQSRMMVEAAALERVAGQLAAGHLILDEDIGVRLKALAATCGLVLQHLAAHEIDVTASSEQPLSVALLMAAVEKAVRDARASQGQATLTRIARLRARLDESRSGLIELQERGSRLASDLPPAEEASLLLAAFSAVLSLVEGESLNNVEWDEAFNLVESTFSRKVAIAASRGQYEVAPLELDVLSAATASAEGTSDSQAVVEVGTLQPTDFASDLPEGDDAHGLEDSPPDEDKATAIPKSPEVSPSTELNGAARHLEANSPEETVQDSRLDEHVVLRQPELPRRSEPRAAARTVGLDSRDIAQRCLASPALDAERDLVWSLVAENATVMAVQFVRSAPHAFDDSIRAVLSASLLSPLVSTDFSEATPSLESELQLAANIDFEATDPELQVTLGALAFNAAAVSAFIAPSTSASSVLRAIRTPAAGSLFELCRSLADASDEIHGLDPATLASLHDHSSREAQWLVLRERAREWFAKAPTHTINFAPATHVWQAWSKDGGILYSLVSAVVSNDVARLPEVARETARLKDHSTLEQEVNRTFLGLRPGGRRIHGDALSQFRRHVLETLALVTDWTESLEERTDVHDYRRRQAERVRRLVLEQLPQVKDDIDRFAKSHPSPASLCATKAFAEGARALTSLFTIARSLNVATPNAALADELLKVDELDLDEHWQILDYEPTRVRSILLRTAAAGLPTWKESLVAKTARGDHRATARIIERAPFSPAERGLFLQEREMRVKECQAAVRKKLVALRGAVEEAVAFGLLRGDERLNLDTTLTRIDGAVVDDAHFGRLLAACEMLQEQLARLRVDAVAEVRARVPNDATIEDADRQRIVALLDVGDILTANEYLVMLQAGQALPAAGTQRDVFLDFFAGSGTTAKSKASLLDEYLQNATIPHIVEKVARRKPLGPLNFQTLNEEQAEGASRMLQAWFTLKKQAVVDEALIVQVLDHLGLKPRSATRRSDDAVDIVADELSDRVLCPVPQIGSLAKGRYRVVLLRTRPLPPEDDIVRTLGAAPSAVPPIVFYFGKLSDSRRRALALHSRERRKALILVDDTLITYLAGESGNRLPALLDCSLPFTFQPPFTTTAGLVPVEMFYGRREECEELMSTAGSSFIFGGRQLGKTALLRHVERLFHSPSTGRIAQWLDLKTIGLGFDLRLEELWPRLVSELKKWEVLSRTFREHSNPERVLEGIAEWLSEGPERRVLLLLDEADKFLETDAKNQFRICDQLKSLMDRTERRFKVVFAGLHNVQRTTRSVNHPLAHFGRAICVGPLLDAEAREARALIERPLGALGYRFESPDLVTRILSQTNYYPSLIQLYCLHLLRYVSDTSRSQFSATSSPPYVITSRHIDEAYRNRDLRQEISARFKLTLQLDSRYEVLAYAFAHAVVVDKRPDVLLDGATPEWFRENAVPWWSEGFAAGGTDNESLRCLLDEMVGLGVFRRVGSNRYALRSPNVAVLLGTEHEISDGLYNQGRVLPAEYAPDTFRRKLAADDPRRSPFTALQEADLRSRSNGVSVAFGCEAAGLGSAGEFLKASFGPEYTQDWSAVTDLDSLRQRLDSLENRPGDGVTLAFLPSSVPWVFSWIAEVKRRVERLTSQKSFVRVLFMADAAKTWQLVGDGEWQTRASAIETLTLRPWKPAALQQWLIDCGFPHDTSAQQVALTVTGGWSSILLDFHDQIAPAPRDYGTVASAWTNGNDRPERVQRLASLFGLHALSGQARFALTLLSQVGTATKAELMSLDESQDPRCVASAVDWAALLGLAVPLLEDYAPLGAGDPQWTTDVTLARILSASTGE